LDFSRARTLAMRVPGRLMGAFSAAFFSIEIFIQLSG
jgi:hypothetical protein